VAKLVIGLQRAGRTCCAITRVASQLWSGEHVVVFGVAGMDTKSRSCVSIAHAMRAILHVHDHNLVWDETSSEYDLQQ
jgi:hypothetical protein